MWKQVNFMLDYPVKPGNDGRGDRQVTPADDVGGGLPGPAFALWAMARQASRAKTDADGFSAEKAPLNIVLEC